MLASVKKFFTFYVRFTPSYSAIGYHTRRLLWKKMKADFSGQTWLVAGGSAGIGGSTVTTAANAGATVIATARGQEQLEAVARSVRGSGQVIAESVDLSLQKEVLRLVDSIQAQGRKIDVLVNNVGVMRHHVTLTEEGFETSFALSLQNHYLLVRELLDRGLLSENATVIEVSSGGMYNHELAIDEMNNQSSSFVAKRAYGLNKRGQVVLTSHWRDKFSDSGLNFYVMHPGWCDTAPVKRDMPQFHKTLELVLRDSSMGADTIIWLAATRPKQKNNESIWLDRKERSVHIYPRTRVSKFNKEDLVAFLEANTHKVSETVSLVTDTTSHIHSKTGTAQ